MFHGFGTQEAVFPGARYHTFGLYDRKSRLRAVSLLLWNLTWMNAKKEHGVSNDWDSRDRPQPISYNIFDAQHSGDRAFLLVGLKKWWHVSVTMQWIFQFGSKSHASVLLLTNSVWCKLLKSIRNVVWNHCSLSLSCGWCPRCSPIVSGFATHCLSITPTLFGNHSKRETACSLQNHMILYGKTGKNWGDMHTSYKMLLDTSFLILPRPYFWNLFFTNKSFNKVLKLLKLTGVISIPKCFMEKSSNKFFGLGLELRN